MASKRKKKVPIEMVENFGEQAIDPGKLGPESAGQSGDNQQLSHIAEASDESVEELADTDQALEASIIEGVEDAADHPERPTHTHLEYPNPEDTPPRRGSK